MPTCVTPIVLYTMFFELPLRTVSDLYLDATRAEGRAVREVEDRSRGMRGTRVDDHHGESESAAAEHRPGQPAPPSRQC